VGRTWLQFAEEVTRLEAEKLRYKVAYDNLRGGDPSTIEIAITPDMRAIIEQDPRIAQLRDKKLTLELELEANLPETPENKEALHTLSKQLEVVDRKLIGLVAQREKDLWDHQLHEARTLYLNATQAELQLRERLTELEAKQRDLDRGLARYRRLEEQQILLEDRRGRILDYISQLRMMVDARGLVRARRVGQAYPAKNLDCDVQILATAAALAVPVAFGLVLLVVRAARRPRLGPPLPSG